MAKPEEVIVDVYNWVKVQGRVADPNVIVTEGIYRHCDVLSRIYTPGLYLGPGESVDLAHLQRLRQYLGKPIRTFDCENPADIPCKVWLSPAIDFTPPFMTKPMPFKKVAILHDVMATRGTFGGRSEMTFQWGLNNYEAVFYISETARKEYEELLRRAERKVDFIPYGCPHRFHNDRKGNPANFCELELFSGGSRDIAMSLSVHSVTARKGIVETARIAEQINTRHYHVGRFADAPPSQVFEAAFVYNVRFLGYQPDSSVTGLMKRTAHFICMSEDEGFSMPAMEAIIQGVPYIILSDIPAHREIYEHCATLIKKGEKVPHRQRVTLEQRRDFFNRYHPDTVVKAMREYIETL